MELKMLPYPLKGYKKSTKGDSTKDLDFIPYHIPEGRPELVSSSHGSINALVLVIPPNGQSTNSYNFEDVLVELVTKMPAVQTFVVLHHEDEFRSRKKLKELLNKNKSRLLPIPVKNGQVDRWIQDIFYPVQFISKKNNTLCLVSGLENYYNSKSAVFNAINDYSFNRTTTFRGKELVFRSSLVPAKGGNILVGKGFLLVGEDSKIYDGIDYSSKYKEWFGLEPIFIKYNVPYTLPQKTKTPKNHIFPNKTKKSKQPIYHIDLFISLAGFSEDGTYILLVGEPVLDLDYSNCQNHQVIAYLHEWLGNIKRSIDSVVQQLEEEPRISFKIIRNPLVLSYEDDIKLERGIYKSRKTNWFWATYNNCLVEISKTKKVWLPSYGGKNGNYSAIAIRKEKKKTIAKGLGLPLKEVKHGNWHSLKKYDLKNKKIWKKLGFEVCLLKSNYIPFAIDEGSLNCITNCIDRI